MSEPEKLRTLREILTYWGIVGQASSVGVMEAGLLAWAKVYGEQVREHLMAEVGYMGDAHVAAIKNAKIPEPK